MSLSLSLALCFLAFPPATNPLLLYFLVLIPERESMKENLIDKLSCYHHPHWCSVCCIGPAHRSLVSLWTGCSRIGHLPLDPVSEWKRVKWHRAWSFLLERTLRAVSRTASLGKQTPGTVCSYRWWQSCLCGCANVYSRHKEEKVRLKVVKIPNLIL